MDGEDTCEKWQDCPASLLYALITVSFQLLSKDLLPQCNLLVLSHIWEECAKLGQGKCYEEISKSRLGVDVIGYVHMTNVYRLIEIQNQHVPVRKKRDDKVEAIGW